LQNVSINKFAEICYIKDSAYIRQLLLGNKLIGKKNGKAWIIDIDNPINAEYMQKRRKEIEGVAVDDTAINTTNTTAINTQNTVVAQNDTTQLIRDLIKEIKELAEEKGKAKLLTDNLIQKEHDLDYWKKQYFEKNAEYDSLLKENTQDKIKAEQEIFSLREKINTLEFENQQLKQKTFFGIKFK